MPHVSTRQAHDTAVSMQQYQMRENGRYMTPQDLVVYLLTDTECYYASNPKEIGAYIREHYEEILEEASDET
jgi:chaperone required for assembly of F1-ATPase